MFRKMNNQCTRTMNATLGVESSVKLLVFALIKISNDYLEDAVVDILNILQQPSFSLKLLNSNIIYLKECQEVTAWFADVCHGHSSQPIKQISHRVKSLKQFFKVAYQGGLENRIWLKDRLKKCEQQRGEEQVSIRTSWWVDPEATATRRNQSPPRTSNLCTECSSIQDLVQRKWPRVP